MRELNGQREREREREIKLIWVGFVGFGFLFSRVLGWFFFSSFFFFFCLKIGKFNFCFVVLGD